MLLLNRKKVIYLTNILKENQKSAGVTIKPDRILVVRTDRIGDVVLTLPVFDALKQHYPDAKTDFLVNKRVFELVKNYPNINKVHAIEKVTVNGIKTLCNQGGYDTVITVYPRFKIALGVFLAGVKNRVGSAYRWYSCLFNLKHYTHRKDAKEHESTYNLLLLKELNCLPEKKLQPSLQVSDDAIRKVTDRIESSGIPKNSKFIVVHVPTLGSAKVWSDDNFKLLINSILDDDEINCYVVLTGTKDEEFHVKHISAGINNQNKLIIMLNLSLTELSALLFLSWLFIGNSTGPIHIAAAVNTYVIGLYSPVKTESPARWGPLTEKKKIFVPLQDDNTRNVMDDIKAVDVYNFIKEYSLN